MSSSSSASEPTTEATWIRRAAEVCRAAAAGDLEPRLLEIDVDGDLGEMLHAINQLLDLTDASLRESRASLEAASEGRFHRRFLEHGMRGAFGRTAASINRASAQMEEQARTMEVLERRRLDLASQFEAGVSGIVSQVAEQAKRLQSTAKDLDGEAMQTVQLAREGTQASGSFSTLISTVASSTSELAAAIDEISKQMNTSSRLAQDALGRVRRTEDQASHLMRSSDRIGSVTDVIRKVAQQTGLLALNANIEAARAGEAGRGFGVVASEVKALSGATSEATDEIQGQIDEVRGVTGEVGTSVRDILVALEEMEGVVAAVAAAVEEQDAVTREVTRGTQTARDDAQSVGQALQGVMEAATRTEAATHGLVDSSSDLEALSTNLSDRVEEFLRAVRGS